MTRLAPYLEQHRPETLNGPGDARPTAAQVVEDQGLVASPEWSGRVILVTGCSPGGLGADTAKALHLTSADVYITARDIAKGKQVADEILADGKPGKVSVIDMDLGSLASVRAGAEEFLRQSEGKLNVLINNAGIMACPQGKTADGFELQFGTNHLAHFYLFHQVKDALLASSTPSFNSRVISVASAAHRYGPLDFDDLNRERTEYVPIIDYGRSKLANIYFANELDRQYQSQDLRAFSLHPGGILTPLARHLANTQDILDDPGLVKTLKNPAQGAATTVWAAVAKELERKGGLYLDEVAEAVPTPPDAPYYAGGYSRDAFNPEAEKRLWAESLRLTGLSE
ncbi:hypothetical protein PV08_09698 [Exophiala spinifera]|uniref:Short-chain dehydrogenase n=1 Tax=Exophiala spinifera TaxID=91928 RepID=A0A0D1YBW8_9EURO|nr:uncharacterized protein PV08_09698 [Exophiala spinifera]KIW12421.1 hypothetical protein PV08_09698 [Exophiala spinifera]